MCLCVYSIYSVRQVKSMVSLIDTFDAETVSHRRRPPRIHPQCLRYVKYCTVYLLLTPLWPLPWLLRLGPSAQYTTAHLIELIREAARAIYCMRSYVKKKHLLEWEEGLA